MAPSNRAAALPRRSSLPAVASAMKPRIDGTLAAVEAPSKSLVNPRMASWASTWKPVLSQYAVRPVMTTATAPKIGP